MRVKTQNMEDVSNLPVLLSPSSRVHPREEEQEEERAASPRLSILHLLNNGTLLPTSKAIPPSTGSASSSSQHGSSRVARMKVKRKLNDEHDPNNVEEKTLNCDEIGREMEQDFQAFLQLMDKANAHIRSIQQAGKQQQQSSCTSVEDLVSSLKTATEQNDQSQEQLAQVKLQLGTSHEETQALAQEQARVSAKLQLMEINFAFEESFERSIFERVCRVEKYCHTLEHQIKHLSQDRDAGKTKVKTLKEQVRKEMQQNLELKHQIEAKERTFRALQVQMRSLQQELKSVTHELRDSQQSMKNIQEQQHERETAMDAIEAKIVQLCLDGPQTSDAKKRGDGQKKDGQKLVQHLCEVEDHYRTFEEHIQTLSQEKKSDTERIKALQEQVQDLVEKNEELKNKITVDESNIQLTSSLELQEEEELLQTPKEESATLQEEQQVEEQQTLE